MLLLLDAFERADAFPLDGPWIQGNNGGALPNLVGGAVQPSIKNADCAMQVVATLPKNCEVGCKIGTFGGPLDQSEGGDLSIYLGSFPGQADSINVSVDTTSFLQFTSHDADGNTLDNIEIDSNGQSLQTGDILGLRTVDALATAFFIRDGVETLLGTIVCTAPPVRQLEFTIGMWNTGPGNDLQPGDVIHASLLEVYGNSSINRPAPSAPPPSWMGREHFAQAVEDTFERPPEWEEVRLGYGQGPTMRTFEFDPIHGYTRSSGPKIVVHRELKNGPTG